MKPVENGKDIPMKPYPGGRFNDFYCPACKNLAAYRAVGIRRKMRGVYYRCRFCNQMLDWGRVSDDESGSD